MKIILILLFSINFIFAYIGKISALKGEANIIRENKTLLAKIGMEIENKDTIYTKNARLQIIFKDRTIITIGKNSKFNIEDYLFNNKNTKMNFNLRRGVVKAITGKISKIAPDRFKIKTKNAVIGIRGTIFVVEYRNNITSLTTIDGITTFTDIKTNKLFEVKKGEQIILNPKKPKQRIIIKKKKVIIPMVIKEKTKKTKQKKETSIAKNSIKKETTINKTKEVIAESKETISEAKSSITAHTTTLTNNLVKEIENINEVIKKAEKTEDVTDTVEKAVETSLINVFEDEFLTLGYYTEDGKPTTTFYKINEDITDEENIEELISSHASAEYAGSVIAVTQDGIAKGLANLSFDFGYESWYGDFSFSSSENNSWIFSTEGTITKDGFKSTEIWTQEESDAKNIKGNINGVFYGKDAALIGGDGVLNSDNKGSASISFGAKPKIITPPAIPTDGL